MLARVTADPRSPLSPRANRAANAAAKAAASDDNLPLDILYEFFIDPIAREVRMGVL